MYRDLFYDLPKRGKNSHSTLIEDSINFVRDFIDPKDEVIDALNDEIERLSERVDELENPEEHAFYKNGQVLSAGGGGSYYYMEKGKKRKIVGGAPGEVWAGLKASMGYNPDDNDFENNIVVNVPRTIVNEIPTGPQLDMNDLGNGKSKDLTVQQVRAKIDPDHDWKVNPDRYESVDEYQVALENEIVEAWDLERNYEGFYNKYRSDEKNEDTSRLRAEARTKRKSFERALDKQRKRLTAYKKIYDAIESNNTITIEGLEDMYDRLSADGFDAISKSEADQFKGWEKGKDSTMRGIVGNYWKDGQRGTDLL